MTYFEGGLRILFIYTPLYFIFFHFIEVKSVGNILLLFSQKGGKYIKDFSFLKLFIH